MVRKVWHATYKQECNRQSDYGLDTYAGNRRETQIANQRKPTFPLHYTHENAMPAKTVLSVLPAVDAPKGAKVDRLLNHVIANEKHDPEPPTFV